MRSWRGILGVVLSVAALVVFSTTLTADAGPNDDKDTDSGQPPKPAGPNEPAPLDIVNPDDVIIQGSLCVGLDCVNNESFGFDTIRLKENNTRITFVDTSSSAGFPTQDWQLTANDSANGGANRFSIEQITGPAVSVPFTIEGGAGSNALFVDSTSRIGLRTNNPVLDLHINTTNTPAIRLEQNSGGGFTAQTWDMAGNEANFFIRDVTGGSRLPLRIRPGAPTSSLDIASDGKVGLGIASPTTQLDVRGGGPATDVFASLSPGGATGFQSFNYGYGGGSFGRSSGFFNVRPDASAVAPNPSLRFLTANVERLIIDNEGFLGLGVANPTSPIHHSTGAILTAGGAWQNASSRAAKQDIVTLTAEEAMEAVRNLQPVKFTYNADPAERYVGFIAEDVPELVATNDRTTLSSLDIVAVLTKVVQDQQGVIERQQATLESLAARLAEIEEKFR